MKRRFKVWNSKGTSCGLGFVFRRRMFGKLTYWHIYEGTFRREYLMVNVHNGKKIKVPCLAQMHSYELGIFKKYMLDNL